MGLSGLSSQHPCSCGQYTIQFSQKCPGWLPQIIPHPTVTNSQPVQSPRKARLEMTPISYNWCPLGRTCCSTWSSRALDRAGFSAPSVQHYTGQCWHGEEWFPPPTTVLPFMVSNYSSIKSYLLLSALLRWFLDTNKVLYLHLCFLKVSLIT